MTTVDYILTDMYINDNILRQVELISCTKNTVVNLYVWSWLCLFSIIPNKCKYAEWDNIKIGLREKWIWVEFICLRTGAIGEFSEHRTEISGSIKGEKLLECLSAQQLIKEDSTTQINVYQSGI
jgi:hypothetical protein